MNNYIINSSTLAEIGDTIRDKSGTSESIPVPEIPKHIENAYKAGQSSMVDESKLLPTTVSGSYISLDDVSEIPHEVKCKVRSANLIDANRLNIGYGISVDTQNDFAVYPNWYTTDLIAVLPNTTYILRGTSSCGRVEYDKNVIPIVWLHSAVTDYTFTTREDTYYVRFNSLIDGYSKPKLIRQIDFTTVQATRTGTNMMRLNDVDASLAGITVKTSGGSLFLNGTMLSSVEISSSTSKLWFKPILLQAGTYTYTAQMIGAGEISEAMLRTNDAAYTRLYSQKVASGKTISTSFTLTEPTSVVGAMWLYNTTYDNSEMRFWLNEGTTALPYEPYNGQTLTPNADGIIEGMTSLSPYMNIFTDTEGVNLTVTYNESWGMHEAQKRFCDVFRQETISNSISFERLTLSKENISSVINALSSTVTGQNVTFKKSAKELFTDDEWAALVATKPNWTFSLI